MPRHMSFALTTNQMRKQTKTETRRVGWDDLKPGDQFWACVKCQGLKKGEKIERICLLECVSNKPEPLNSITKFEVVAEGFPQHTPAEFVSMFCKSMRVEASQIINVIRFKYVEPIAQSA